MSKQVWTRQTVTTWAIDLPSLLRRPVGRGCWATWAFSIFNDLTIGFPRAIGSVGWYEHRKPDGLALHHRRYLAYCQLSAGKDSDRATCPRSIKVTNSVDWSKKAFASIMMLTADIDRNSTVHYPCRNGTGALPAGPPGSAMRPQA
jgi:hypothetical protein